MSKHTTLEQLKLLAQRTKGEISKVESKSLVGVKVNGVALAIADKMVDILIASGTANGTLAVNGKDVAMTEDNGSVSAIVPFKVTNVRGPEMPKTGDRGTWLYTAGGVMLVSLAAGGILICIKRRKNQPESK